MRSTLHAGCLLIALFSIFSSPLIIYPFQPGGGGDFDGDENDGDSDDNQDSFFGEGGECGDGCEIADNTIWPGDPSKNISLITAKYPRLTPILATLNSRKTHAFIVCRFKKNEADDTKDELLVSLVSQTRETLWTETMEQLDDANSSTVCRIITSLNRDYVYITRIVNSGGSRKLYIYSINGDGLQGENIILDNLPDSFISLSYSLIASEDNGAFVIYTEYSGDDHSSIKLLGTNNDGSPRWSEHVNISLHDSNLASDKRKLPIAAVAGGTNQLLDIAYERQAGDGEPSGLFIKRLTLATTTLTWSAINDPGKNVNGQYLDPIIASKGDTFIIFYGASGADYKMDTYIDSFGLPFNHASISVDTSTGIKSGLTVRLTGSASSAIIFYQDFIGLTTYLKYNYINDITGRNPTRSNDTGYEITSGAVSRGAISYLGSESAYDAIFTYMEDDNIYAFRVKDFSGATAVTSGPLPIATFGGDKILQNASASEGLGTFTWFTTGSSYSTQQYIRLFDSSSMRLGNKLQPPSSISTTIDDQGHATTRWESHSETDIFYDTPAGTASDNKYTITSWEQPQEHNGSKSSGKELAEESIYLFGVRSVYPLDPQSDIYGLSDAANSGFIRFGIRAPAITDVSPMEFFDDAIVIKIEANSTASDIETVLYRGADDGPFETIAFLEPNQTYSDAGLKKGHVYSYKAQNHKNSGDTLSAFSGVMSITLGGTSEENPTASAPETVGNHPSGGGGGKRSWCYTATATFKYSDNNTLKVLNSFKHQRLNYPTGKLSVMLYNRIAPSIANKITKQAPSQLSFIFSSLRLVMEKFVLIQLFITLMFPVSIRILTRR